jgi:hypothetical protein
MSLMHMAMITMPTSKYNVHKAAMPRFSVASVFLPGTKSPNPIVVNVIKQKYAPVQKINYKRPVFLLQIFTSKQTV